MGIFKFRGLLFRESAHEPGKRVVENKMADLTWQNEMEIKSNKTVMEASSFIY